MKEPVTLPHWRPRIALRAAACGENKDSMTVTAAPNRAKADGLTATLLLLMVGGFYWLTLAPTVLWGDDAFYQRSAVENYLPADGGGHWLWLQIARAAVALPVGDAAYRVNLVSALGGALTIAVLYLAARALDLSPAAALVPPLSLAVAHTFWTHAVRAEVYTIFTALMALQFRLWFLWRREQPRPIYLALLLSGVTLLGHQMGILLVPGLVYLVWRRRLWLSRRQWLALYVCGAVGLVPFVVVVQRQVGVGSIAGALQVYFTRSGADFGRVMFDFSVGAFGRDLALWLGFLGLQFAGPAGLAALYALFHVRTWAADVRLQSVLIVYATGVGFAFSYRVNDQFVFYLPSYLAFALLAGLGSDLFLQRRPSYARRRAWSLLSAAVVLTPVILYLLLAGSFARLGVNPLAIRELPGREPNWFFLWPAKQGYWGAAWYGENALAVLPEGSMLIADHTPYQTLGYLQAVGGKRRDVSLRFVEAGADLEPIIASARPGQAVFLADDDPRYYNLSRVPDALLTPAGVVYRLTSAAALSGPSGP